MVAKAETSEISDAPTEPEVARAETYESSNGYCTPPQKELEARNVDRGVQPETSEN